MNSINFLNKYFTCSNAVVLLEGTRALPSDDYIRLVEVGKQIAKNNPNCIFRSGNACGTDEAFINGVAKIDKSNIELILPFKKHRIKSIPSNAVILTLEDLTTYEIEELKKISIKANPKSSSLIKLYDPAKTSLLSIKSSFLLRDTLKVVGLARKKFQATTVGLFYVNPNNQLGGTGFTINVCKYLGVATYTQKDFLDFFKL